MKKSRWPFWIGLFLLLAGCTWDTGIQRINHYILVHDNSSKVWLVDKMLKDNRDYTPLQMEYKEMVVFHRNNTAYFYVFHEFGKKPGKKMTFWLDEEKNEFGFDGVKKDLLFEIIAINRNKIHLKPKNNSYPYQLVLIPFPEY